MFVRVAGRTGDQGSYATGALSFCVVDSRVSRAAGNGRVRPMVESLRCRSSKAALDVHGMVAGLAVATPM